MNTLEKGIGKNIRDLRLERGLSQEALAGLCNFSNTTLSAYENSRKIPNLTTVARIAKHLNVDIERLYYGDENSSFINTESDEGKKIVNSIYLLWSLGVVNYFENPEAVLPIYGRTEDNNLIGSFLSINEFRTPIKRFINSLNEFERNKSTYYDPDKYLEMLKDSVATEINNEIKRKLEEEKSRKERK